MSTEWSTKIKALRALVSSGPEGTSSHSSSGTSSRSPPPTRTPPIRPSLAATMTVSPSPTTTQPSPKAEEPPEPPIRRLSHKQIDDVQKLVRDTLEQSGLDTSDGDSHNARIANAVASAVARAVTTALNKAEDSQSDEVDVLRRRNNELEQRSQSVEHQLLTTEKRAGTVSVMDNNARALLSECERWPFTLATKEAVMEARNSVPPQLNPLLGLHLSLGRHCRTMREEKEMLKKVIDHMKEESQRRQLEQQQQIDELKRRLLSSSTGQQRQTTPLLYTNTLSSSSPRTTLYGASPPASFTSPRFSTSPRSSTSPSVIAPHTPPVVTTPTDERERLIRQKLRANAYGPRGINWKRLFRFYDRDNSGALQYNEFKNAVRKDGKMTKNQLSDNDLLFLFRRVDRDGGGSIEIEEFSKWLKNTTTSTRSTPPPAPSSSGSVGDRGDGNVGSGQRARSNSMSSQRSISSNNRTNNGVHMTTSDFAKARRSIRHGILHLVQKIASSSSSSSSSSSFSTKNNNSTNTVEAIHDLWNTHFRTYRERGDIGIGLSGFRTAIRRSLNITSAEVSDTHVRGLFDHIDDNFTGFIEYPEFRDWLSGSKRRNSGMYTPGLHDHHIQDVLTNDMNLGETTTVDPLSPRTTKEWHTNSTTGTSYGLSFSRKTASARAERARELEIERKRTSALSKGVSPDTLMSRLGMGGRGAVRQLQPQPKIYSNSTTLVAKDSGSVTSSLSPQIAAIPTLVDDPYILEQKANGRGSPTLAHAHRRLNTWGLGDQDLLSTYGTYATNIKGKKKRNTKNSSSLETSSPAVATADILPEYRKFKSAYRKQYAAHLQGDEKKERQQQRQQQEARSQQIHQHVTNYRHEIHNTTAQRDQEAARNAKEWSQKNFGSPSSGAMERYTVDVVSSSSSQPAPPPPPPPPSGPPPPENHTGNNHGQLHQHPHQHQQQRQASRQRRVSILSPETKKKILLKSREDARQKSKDRLLRERNTREKEELDNDNDYGYGNSPEQDGAQEDYDAMINDLDGILDIHPKEVRQRRASYNMVKEAVGDINTPAYTSNLTPEQQLEISQIKQAPTWILTRGISNVESQPRKNIKNFKWSTLEAERKEKEVHSRMENDVRNAKKKKREERVQRNKTARMLYGKGHHILRESSIIQLSTENAERLEQVKNASAEWNSARDSNHPSKEPELRPSDFDLTTDELPAPPPIPGNERSSSPRGGHVSSLSIRSMLSILEDSEDEDEDVDVDVQQVDEGEADENDGYEEENFPGPPPAIVPLKPLVPGDMLPPPPDDLPPPITLDDMPPPPQLPPPDLCPPPGISPPALSPNSV